METDDKAAALSLLGGNDKRLTVDQGEARLAESVCRHFNNDKLAEKIFWKNCAASVKATKLNGWKTTPLSFLEDIDPIMVCRALARLHDTNDVISIDMRACYPASLRGKGEAWRYFKNFGHSTHRMTRAAINGSLIEDIIAGFAQLQEFGIRRKAQKRFLPQMFGSLQRQNAQAAERRNKRCPVVGQRRSFASARLPGGVFPGTRTQRKARRWKTQWGRVSMTP